VILLRRVIDGREMTLRVIFCPPIIGRRDRSSPNTSRA
jgi:hypothetical protein